MIMMNSKGRDRALGTVYLEYSHVVDIYFMLNVDVHTIYQIGNRTYRAKEESRVIFTG